MSPEEIQECLDEYKPFSEYACGRHECAESCTFPVEPNIISYSIVKLPTGLGPRIFHNLTERTINVEQQSVTRFLRGEVHVPYIHGVLDEMEDYFLHNFPSEGSLFVSVPKQDAIIYYPSTRLLEIRVCAVLIFKTVRSRVKL